MKKELKSHFSSFSVITVFIALIIIGATLIPSLNIQLKPSSTSTSIRVSYSWTDASAKVIEQEVTSKLEGVFNNLKGIKGVSSTSDKGHGSINIDFKNNRDMDAARFELASLIRQTYSKLPEGVSYPEISMSLSSYGEATLLSYSINANESPYYIKRYVDKNLVPKLSTIDGVGRVSVYGAAPYQWVITYNAEKLFQLGISASQVSGAVRDYFSREELGMAEVDLREGTGKKEISVSLAYKEENELDWAHIPIGTSEGRTIYLGEIAKIRFQEGKVTSYYRINGKNTINMVLLPEKGVNTIRLAQKLRDRIERFKSSLPVGYQVKLTYDSTTQLTKELQKIKLRSFFSLVILLILAIALYRNIKYISILFLSIFTNLLVAIIFYYFFQIELQLYSFAGITISFGIIIDNTIIMLDHLRKYKNKKVFLAILSATLTTIGAVMIIFMLEESQRANLWDFALVIAINLGVSLVVAFYGVPALMEKFNLQNQIKHYSRKNKRCILWLTKGYARFLYFTKRPTAKWISLSIAILSFGIPLHLAPHEIKGEGFWEETYNKTLGQGWFQDEIRPELEKYIGGSLRLFIENVFESSYYAEPERTSLRVTGTMPEGHTIEQLNEVVKKLEQYIASFDEVSLFETRIRSYRNSNIQIYFNDKYEKGSFPYTLKNLIEEKVINLGGLDWTVSGVGRGFSNALGKGYKSDRIQLQGYNYDDLYHYAEKLREQVVNKSNGRVRDVVINSGQQNREVLQEYYLYFDPERLASAQVGASQLYSTLKNQLHSSSLPSIVQNNELQEVKLISSRYQEMNVWDLKNEPLIIGDNQYKLGSLAEISRRKTGNIIKKENQQYQLMVAYDFIGPNLLAQKFRNDRIEELNEVLPIGYKVFQPSYSNYWSKEDKKQYYYLFVIIAVIFFICAVLLESLIQPLAIIVMIPISYIGVFLTFYFFELNFDQGGYASFILLSGISVNAALYIVNDFNNLKKRFPYLSSMKLYLKAFNHKIVPVLITIVSTVGGLIPFVWSGQQEVFWFSFAAGSIGGLLFSLIGIWLYLPMLVVCNRSKNKNLSRA